MATPILGTSTEKVLLFDTNNDKVIVQGTTKPVDTTTGYAKGCYFIDTDVVTGTSGVYFNKGTNLSCVFELAPVASTGTFTTVDASGLITAEAGILSNDDITLGAGDDLVGSATSNILINTNKFTVAGATGNTVIAGTASVAGLLTATAGIDGKVIFAGTETIAAGGTSTALALTKTLHNIDADAGGDTFTLADGIAGQIIVCVLKTATGVATITPATFTGGTSVTLNAAGDSVMFVFQTTLGWSIVGGNSYAVV